jgi:hypothetical protein
VRRLVPALEPFDPFIADEVTRQEARADGRKFLIELPRKRGYFGADDVREFAFDVGEAVGNASVEPDVWDLDDPAFVVLTAISRFIDAATEASHSGPEHSTAERWYAVEARAQAELLRDLVGHLFHPDHLWVSRLDRTDETARIAGVICQERAFTHLPVLADALEDAGCADAEVLSRCRRRGEHARGCWVLDAILGRN